MVSSSVIVDFTISSRSFVFSQSDVQIPAGLTNKSGLAIAAFDLIICPLDDHTSPTYDMTPGFKPLILLRCQLSILDD